MNKINTLNEHHSLYIKSDQQKVWEKNNVLKRVKKNS